MNKYVLIACLVLLFGVPCQAREWRAVVTTADLFLWRPLSFAGTIAGGALWLVSLPVTIPSKSECQVRDTLVRTPYQWTFERPLADIED